MRRRLYNEVDKCVGEYNEGPECCILEWVGDRKTSCGYIRADVQYPWDFMRINQFCGRIEDLRWGYRFGERALR